VRFLGIQRPGPADLMTLVNASCGAAAVLVVVSYAGRPVQDLATSGIRTVTLLLLVGTIFDTLDGAFARRGGGTELGGMLDSLADALSFGLAPAVLLAQLGMRGATTLESAFVVVGFLCYVGCALLRLADFSSCRHADAQFTGLPSPLAAGLVVAIAFLTTSPVAVAVGLGVVGLMMVSRLAYPKQRGPVVAAALFAWVFGIAGTLGAYDLRIAAVVMLFVIGIVMPALPALVPHERAHV